MKPESVLLAFAQLSILPIQPERNRTGYDRTFYWTTNNGCTTRQRVLQRDCVGSSLNTSICIDPLCTWFCPYDNRTLNVSSALDIDHIVPLAEVWDSGGNTWTPTQFQNYGNDMNVLLSVSATSNRAKGDADPAEWMPNNKAYWCDYVCAWIRIKTTYSLSADLVEWKTLNQTLHTCYMVSNNANLSAPSLLFISVIGIILQLL